MADELQKQSQMPSQVGALAHFYPKGNAGTAHIPSKWLYICAFGVHLYTASGAVLAFFTLLLVVSGNLVAALWLGLVAMLIDGTDGWLARRVRVKEVLPWFDGRRLDDIVDYLTYVFTPVFLLWKGGYLPTGSGGMIVAVIPLLASCYQFCRVDAKTADAFFLGFPSYWNIVAFYTVVFNLAPATVTTILLACSLLVFVPVRYLYPSRTAAFRTLTLAFTGLWLLLYAVILWQMPRPNPFLLYFSLLYAFYYVGLSLYLTYRAHAFSGKRS